VNLLESFMTAMAALLANKFRALLTMLGVIIGVSAVITMIAIGEGAQQAVVERIEALGSNLLFVSPGVARGGGMFVRQSGSSVRLKREDAEAIRDKSSVVEAVIPEVSRSTQVKYENKNWGTRIVGTVPEYEHGRNVPIASGRYFTHAEDRGVAKVCVLGPVVVENLLGESDPLGKRIRISGQTLQ